jgi:hypothetical protein
MCGYGDLLEILRNDVIKICGRGESYGAEGGLDYAKLRDVQVTRFRLNEVLFPRGESIGVTSSHGVARYIQLRSK